MVERLAEYLHWANHRALASLEGLGEPPRNLIDIFAHLLAAEEVWLCRLNGATPTTPVWPPDVPLARCAEWIDRNSSGYGEYLALLSPERLASEISYLTSKGDNFRSRVSDILLQVLSHGSYHRGQIALGVKSAGGVPAATDYVFFARG